MRQLRGPGSGIGHRTLARSERFELLTYSNSWNFLLQFGLRDKSRDRAALIGARAALAIAENTAARYETVAFWCGDHKEAWLLADPSVGAEMGFVVPT
jgi:hypothetical protein